MESNKESVSEICKKRREIVLKELDRDENSSQKNDDHKILKNDHKNKDKIDDKSIRDLITEKILLTEDKNQKISKDVKEEYKSIDENVLFVYDKMKQRNENAPKTVIEEVETEETDGIERRLQDSDKILSELIQLGTELVTNVKVANEKREVARRNNEASKREELLQALRNESVEAITKFDEITSKWSELGEIKEPMGLYEELQVQKQRMNELLKQKDNILEKCKKEIERADQIYYDDIQRQNSDICSLVERIDNQIELVKKSYNDHIELLQNTIENERKKMAEKATKDWEILHNKWLENEQIKLENKKFKENLYDKELERIKIENEEMIRTTRIQLEKDTDAVQRELRTTKYNIFLNTEKFNYNYQILQKRDTENTTIRLQQKIRLNKLNETISNLIRKIEEMKLKIQNDIQHLRKEILQLQQNIDSIQLKANRMELSDIKKYQAVWEIHDQEAKNLIQRILDIDRILHEQQLCLEWISPSSDLFPSLEKFCLQKGIKFEEPFEEKSKEIQKTNKTDEQKLINTRLLQNILPKIADYTGFLIEDKLLEILKPYTEKQKTLVKIDNIFTALGINNVEDIESMIEYFLPYSWCPNCMPSGVEKEKINQEIQTNFNKEFQYNVKDVNQETDTETSKEQPKAEGNRNLVKTCTNHNLVIESELILTALRNFLQQKSLEESQNNNSKGKCTNGSSKKRQQIMMKILSQMNKNDIEEYWSKYLLLFPEKKMKLWKHLEHGLNYYLKILKEREQLNSECEALKRQNIELHHLLKKHKSMPQLSEK